eukprot:scaffold25714_cov30-Tisochrysis_lutea.AAC.7
MTWPLHDSTSTVHRVDIDPATALVAHVQLSQTRHLCPVCGITSLPLANSPERGLSCHQARHWSSNPS